MLEVLGVFGGGVFQGKQADLITVAGEFSSVQMMTVIIKEVNVAGVICEVQQVMSSAKSLEGKIIFFPWHGIERLEAKPAKSK